MSFHQTLRTTAAVVTTTLALVVVSQAEPSSEPAPADPERRPHPRRHRSR